MRTKLLRGRIELGLEDGVCMKTEIAYAQTPVDKIEVTLAMIEAGQAIFAPHIMTIAPVFVAEIYRAMERVRRESSGMSQSDE